MEFATRSLNWPTNEMTSSCVQIKPYNMRYVSLENFPLNERRNLNKITLNNRSKEEFIINCPFKSISLLKKLLQTKINQEIKEILMKYSKVFLEPALLNVRENLRNNDLANELNVNYLMHEILDEAKKMFPIDVKNDWIFKRLQTENNINNGEQHHQESCSKNISHHCHRTRGRPAKQSFNEMISTTTTITKAKNKNSFKSKVKRRKFKRGLVSLNNQESSAIFSKSSKSKINNNHKIFDDVKWDPSRLNTKTLFVLGSKANKALGFGAARGRLYSKHSDLFRYIGDHEDKEWLHKNNLMPPTGGKAYLLVKDDIIELINSNEYCDMPGVNIDDMGDGFTVPQSMIDKMTECMRITKNNSIKTAMKLNANNKSSNNDTNKNINNEENLNLNNDNDDEEEEEGEEEEEEDEISLEEISTNNLLRQTPQMNSVSELSFTDGSQIVI